MPDALQRFAGLPVFMVQWSRIEIAGEVRAAHAPVLLAAEIKWQGSIAFHFVTVLNTHVQKNVDKDDLNLHN